MATIVNNIRWADNTAELKRNLLEGIGTIDAMKTAVDRTVASLSGQGLFAAANRAAAAIQQMGGALGTAAGVTKLTSAELERNTALIDKASEKYKAMFGFVPQGWKDLSAEMEKAGEKTVQVSDVIGLIGSKFGVSTESITKFLGPLGEVSAVAAGVAVGLAGAAVEVLHLAHAAAETGDHINDTALKMGIGAEQASALGSAVKIAGGDADQLANGVFMMSKRLEDAGASGESARAALKGIGIDAKEFLNLDADKQILAISDAFREVKPNADQVNDIFGRMGKDLLPVLSKDISGLVDEMKRLGLAMTDDEVKAAVEAAEETRKMHVEWDKFTTDIGIFFLPALKLVDKHLEGIISSFRTLSDLVKGAGDWWGVLSGNVSAPSTANSLAKGLGKSQDATANDITRRAATAPGVKDVFDIAARASRDFDDQIQKGIQIRKQAQKAFEEMAQAMIDLQDETDLVFAGILLGVNSRTIGNGLAAAGPGKIGLSPDSGVNHSGIGNLPGIFGNGVAQNPQGGAFPAAGPAKIPSKTFSTSGPSVFGDIASSVPNAILAAIEGGGSKLQAAGSAIGNTLFGRDSSLTKSIGGMFSAEGILGKTLSSAVPIIGSLIGPAMEGLGKLWGKVFGTAGRDAVRDFASSQGGFDTLHEKLGALGADGEALWKNLTQGVGRNNPEQAKAAIDKVNAAFEAQRQKIVALQTQLDGVGSKLSKVTTLGPGLQAALDKALSATNANGLKSALADINTEIDKQQAKFDLVKTTLAKYSIPFTAAGKEFKQAALNETAKGLIDDFNVLAEAGVDVKTEVHGMSDGLSKFAQDAKKAGVEVPEAMRPILEAAIAAGSLFDRSTQKIGENGEALEANGDKWNDQNHKFTDLSQLGLEFGTTMQTVMTKTIPAAIDRLNIVLEGLANFLHIDLPKAAADGASKTQSSIDGLHGTDVDVNIHRKLDPADSPDYGGQDPFSGSGIEGSSTGSIVRPWGLEHFINGGIVAPDNRVVAVSDGELIMNVAQQKNVADALTSAPAININFYGPVLAAKDYVEQHMVEPIITGIQRYHRAAFGRLVASVTP